MNNEIIKISQQLIKFKTETGNFKEISSCFDFISCLLGDTGNYKSKTIKKNSHQSMVISKNKEPDIFLVGHIDVVPALDKMYEPKVKRGRIYGRGACDMKCSIAAMLLAFREIIKNNTAASIGIILTSDEEVGGFSGVSHILSLGYKSKIAIIPDGGPNFSIVEKEKGVLHLMLYAKGKSAHASRNWLGENAIDILCDSLLSIRHLFPRDNHNNWERSINIGRIQGGDAVNTVPARAFANIDIRLTESDNADMIINMIRAAAGDKVVVKVDINEPTTNISREHPEVIRLQNIYQRKTGKFMGFERSHGTTDSRHFYKRGINSLIFMPDAGGHHSNNEWVDIESLNLYYEILLDYIYDYHYHFNKE
ncbi:MAG: Succinyl-diaminopimelate desuccinylase [bacterium ADurb.Bin212]|nr:MAG: Succinyl-diaminopimelate desuccinylase [bacterium ADurb.Bin212]